MEQEDNDMEVMGSSDDDDERNQRFEDLDRAQVESQQSWRKKMYYDSNCSNNISRSMRVIPMRDAQVRSCCAFACARRRSFYV